MPFPPRFRTCLMTGCEYCRGGGRLLLPRAVNCRPQTQTLFPNCPLLSKRNSSSHGGGQRRLVCYADEEDRRQTNATNPFLFFLLLLPANGSKSNGRPLVPPSSFLPWWQSGGAGQGSLCTVARFTPIFSSSGRRQGLPSPLLSQATHFSDLFSQMGGKRERDRSIS